MSVAYGPLSQITLILTKELSFLDAEGDSVADISSFTLAVVAAWSVDADGVLTTATVVYRTLVHVYTRIYTTNDQVNTQVSSSSSDRLID